MVINHLEKLFVTNDAATIIRELEVEHPAAKMMILGSQMMEQEVRNFHILFINSKPGFKALSGLTKFCSEY